jgi:hypothetical protein
LQSNNELDLRNQENEFTRKGKGGGFDN